MADKFTVDELRTVAYDLGMENEAISGTTPPVYALGLIVWAVHRGKIKQLEAIIYAERPNAIGKK